MTKPQIDPDAQEHGEDDHVEDDEREARQEHANVQSVVALDLRLGHYLASSVLAASVAAAGAAAAGAASPDGSSDVATCDFQRGDLGVDVRGPLRLVELGLDVVVRAREVGQGTGGEELVERTAARLHLGDLVLGALHRGAGVTH